MAAVSFFWTYETEIQSRQDSTISLTNIRDSYFNEELI